MADGYISQIKTPDNKTYLLKDSEKTDEKVKQTSNAENKEFPIILKNTNNTTNETAGVKYAGGVSVNPSDKTVTATEFIGNIKANRVKPTIIKEWNDTSFYGANISGQDVHDLSTFWMLSVKPDSWYEPWIVRFKITTTCPAAANYYSVTYCMYSGRADGIVVFNWNERYDHAHYYTNVRTLKRTGFDAGLGHAIGINLYASNNYTNANYYRSFKLEYYDCDNCTVTILDNPIKWANWPNGTTTNYNGNNNANAVDRGLQESGDANSYDLLQMSNTYLKNGSFRFPGISLFGYDREGHAQPFSLYQSDYTSYTASISNKATRLYNTNGIDWTRGIHYNSSGGSWAGNADMNISIRLAQSAIDLRYTDNCVSTANTTLSMISRKPVYIRGTLDDNGLFYVAPLDVTYSGATYCRVWTQDIPTQVDNYVYWFIGYPYYTSAYQVNLYVENPLYWFHNGRFEEYKPASTINLADVTNADDLKAIEAISGTSGLLKKTAANTWTLDTNTYLTAHRTYTAVSGKKPTGNQTPGFGSTFDIEQVGQDTTGQVSVTERTVKIPDTAASTSAAGLVTTGAQTLGGGKTLRFTSRIYPRIGTTGEKSKWYKITFPYYDATTSSSAKWFMNSFDLHFGGGYASNATGVAHVTFYWTRAANNGAWAVGQQAAFIEGTLANKIGLYYRIAEPGVLYVNNTANVYNGIWIDNLYVDDTSPSLDWSTITITNVADITESTSPKLSDYTKITTSYLYNDGGTLKTDSNFEGKYIKGTWLYTSAATAKTSTSKLATIESDNFIYYITPANALKSAIGTTAIGAAATPIYWDGSKIVAGTVLGTASQKAESYFVKAITSTDEAIVRFSGTAGQVQDSKVTINDNGTITLPTEQDIDFRMNRKTTDGGGWAHGYLNWYDKANNIFAVMGLYGTNDALDHIYIGSNTTYSSDVNLQIYANGTIKGKLFSGSGASLTSLNASNLSSGTVPVACLPLATTSAAGVVKIGSGISVSDGTISVTAANLGLSNAMHFIGIATKAISDGGTEDPTISGYSTKTAGDVIIDKDTRREYVWSTAGKWEMLGFDASAKYEKTTSGNTFISKITQATDGTVTAESRALDTSGTWSGNAATATTATNLANNPSIQASTSNTNQVTITAGGKTSSAYTIPYATSAGSATSATSATTATYIKCTDTRSTALNPTDLNAAQGIRFDFKAKGTINLTATDVYAGVMSFRPYASNSDWSGGNAHQLAFNSEGLHWRNGGASWGNWYQILDSSNTTTGTNNTATLTWNTTYTIAKINGTDIKFTTMTKPTYAFSDLTSHPTTLSDYGITNAVQYNGIDNDIGSSATAANAKSYWANNNKVPKGKVVFNYNSSGTEFTTLFSNNNNSYGSILRWGYQDKYIRILRAHPTQGTYDGWYTEDWEKISAGYADTAPWSGVSNKPTTLSGYGITDAKIASGVITLGSNTITPVTSVNGHNGSSVSVTASDLGLASALKYVGTKSSLPTATDSTTYSTYNNGDVITVSSKEYAYVKGSNAAGSSWVELGDEGSYKLKQTAFTNSTGTADSTNTSTTFIYSFSQDENGTITNIKTRSLPTATNSVAGITKVGASGGAAAYSHTHSYLANTNTGAADRPIYITGNAAAQTTYRMAGTNVAATTGITYSGDLDTGIWYVNGISGTDKTTLYNQADGVIIANKYSTSWISEIYQDYRTGQLAIRGKNNGTWAAWRNILDSTNYTDYAVAKTAGVTAVTWDATNKKLTRTINGTAADVMTAAQMGTALGLGTVATYNVTGGNEGYSSSATLIPRIGTDGVMEVGKYIDFHASTGTSKDYDVRITAATTGLTISGTTSGTFSGSLSGNATTATTATNLSAAPTIASGGTATVNLAEDTAYTLTVGGKSVIFKTPADTATAADNILDGSNSGTAITYAPYTAKQDKLSFDTSTTAPNRTDRLNLNGFLYATKYNVAGQVTLQWNATDSSLEFVFA